MTDKRTTELLRKLRKMLDGCRRTETVGFDTYWITANALDSSLDELEQAIAATLGSGTLTAEQVRKALLYHLPHREYYSIEQTDAWQAIADELNAKLESRTCEMELLVRDLMKFIDCYISIPLGDEAEFFDAVERLNERIDELGIEVD